MRAAEELLAALSCPVADSGAIDQMLAMAPEELLTALDAWLGDIKHLNPELQFVTAALTQGDLRLHGSFHAGQDREEVVFALVDSATLGACSTDDDLEGLAAGAGLTVLCTAIDPDNTTLASMVDRLIDLSGSPVPRWLVLEPAWLAAAVVVRAKPFVHGRMRDDDQSIEPYFTGTHVAADAPKLSRVGGSTRRTIDQVRLEPRSLPEKVREISLRVAAPGIDTTIVTTFLPSVTHSQAALVRYYSGSQDREASTQLIGARKAAERQEWELHIAKHEEVLVIDRQQVEEYFVGPEYYQMLLTPDELDEQVDYFIFMLQHENFSVAFCPEAIDIPYHLTSDMVEIRGDRRNRSEPRPGRVNGLTLTDPSLIEDLRREAASLVQMTEPQFKDKQFVSWWITWLAGNYRRTYRRGGPL